MPAQPAADLLIATGTPTQLRYLLSRLSVQIAEADFAAPAYVDQKCCARSYDGSRENCCDGRRAASWARLSKSSVTKACL
jgi:hypothetical protein